MAIAFDAATEFNAGSATSHSWTHTCSGADRLLLVGFGLDTSPDMVTSVTYNGVAMTRIGFLAVTGRGGVYLYRLLAPATGANTVTATLSTAGQFAGGAVSYTGVDQTTPLGTVATASGSSTTPSVNVASAAGELVVDAVSYRNAGNPTLTGGAGQTERVNEKTGTDNGAATGGMSEEAGAAAVTMNWSLSSSTGWAIIGVPLKPVVAAAAQTHQMML